MLLGELDIDGNPALHSLHKLSEGIENFEHKVKQIGVAFGGFYLAFEAIEKIVSGFEGVLSLGAHMEALHNTTGASVHDLVIFSHALETAGGSAEAAQNFIFKLQNAIAGVNEDGKSTATALHLLGTSAGELRNLPLLGQVEKISQGLAKIPDQATKVAAIKDLFGFRFAAQAMPLLSNPEALEHAIKAAGPMADVLDKNAHKFHELEVAIKDASSNMQGFFAGALEGVAPEATGIAEALGSIDFVGIGRGVGSILSVFLSLAHALTPLIPLINGIAKAFDGMMQNSALRGLVIGATVGTLIGPEGTIFGAIGGGLLGMLFGGDHKDGGKAGFADAFRGMSSGGDPAKAARVGALQRIGLGGGFSGASDPLLTEAQKQTNIQMEIRDGIRALPRSTGIPGIDAPPV